jgi:hypothetical protein
VKRLPLFILAWLAYAAVMIPLTVVGIVLVAVLALFPGAMQWRDSRHYKDGRKVLCWRWKMVDALFGNDEDGIHGLPVVFEPPVYVTQPRQHWWRDKTQGWSLWRMVFIWAGLRNSVANARFLPFFGLLINPQRVGYAANAKGWWLAWQGWQAGFRWYWNAERYFWVGWKVKPADSDDFLGPVGTTLPDRDTRAPGVGFAFQPWGK